jgi:dTDP-4-dehydrorhamnose reductase
MNVLVLGSNGMIGNAIFSILRNDNNIRVFGSLRDLKIKHNFFFDIDKSCFIAVDPFNLEALVKNIKYIQPDLIINCIGITKHVFKKYSKEAIKYINSEFPYQLKILAETYKCRILHISTDCVFSGDTGDYKENDIPDAIDLYGMTKKKGEILNSSNVLTLRTSTIGHENNTNYGLLEWFLSQTKCSGYPKAIFSGLTNVEFAKIIRDFIIWNKKLSGLYHVGGLKINKYDLLVKINEEYKNKVILKKNYDMIINRSLNSDKFRLKTNYIPKEWNVLISEMNKFYK